MKSIPFITAFLCLLAFTSQAQTDPLTQTKKYSVSVGLGYFSPVISEQNVSFSDAEYSPEIGFGASFFASFDYALTENLYFGVGYNGNYGTAKFIKNAVVNGQQINGYLKAGALENSAFLLNVTYSPVKTGIQPYAKFGAGYFISELELGDIPLNLTGNVEKELFPDYKASGFGILPEVGLKYNRFFLSVTYGLPFQKLTGEKVTEPGAFNSAGTIKSHSLQINAAYRIFIF